MSHGGSGWNSSRLGRDKVLLWRIRIAAECARLESVYRATYRGFKSLILRSKVGNSLEVTSDENSYAELDDFCTIPDVPISNGYLTKITAERARRERPDFTAPVATNEVQKALVGKPLEKVVRFAPVIQAKDQAPESTKIIKLDGGRISIIDAIQLFGWKPDTRFAWQLDRSSLTLIAQEDGDLAFDASNRILIPMNLRRRLNIKSDEQVLVLSDSSPVANVQITPINQIHKYIKEAKQ